MSELTTKNDATTALSPAEKNKLNRLESIIKEGLAKFLQVGSALHTINKEKLYRSTHPSFAAYLTDKWDIQKKHGYRLIHAAEVVINLERHSAKILPQNEAIARVLTQFSEEQQPKIWEKVVERTNGKGISATVVTTIANELYNKTVTEEQKKSKGKRYNEVQINFNKGDNELLNAMVAAGLSRAKAAQIISDRKVKRNATKKNSEPSMKNLRVSVSVANILLKKAEERNQSPEDLLSALLRSL